MARWAMFPVAEHWLMFSVPKIGCVPMPNVGHVPALKDSGDQQ
jgi:hypothetical protein